jgi:hypothetical protein
MSITQESCPGSKALARRFYCRARSLACVILLVFSVSGAPASASRGSYEDAATRGSGSADLHDAIGQYDQVFSGLAISTERIAAPAIESENPGGAASSDLRFWTRSKILVLRVWRGAPPTIAEVWSPGGSSCDLAVMAGFHFVALVRTENGRSIARNSECDSDVMAATKERGTYTNAGVAIIAASFCVAALALTWLGISIRRRRRSVGSRQRLPLVLSFVATVLPVCPAIYLIAFQSVIAAATVLVILLFWSNVIARLSALDVWKRNAGWLLSSVVGVVGIALIPIKLDSSSGEVSLIGTLTSSGFWVIVAVAVALTLSLLNALSGIHSRIPR